MQAGGAGKEEGERESSAGFTPSVELEVGVNLTTLR